ncbi:class I SAM-dependent methyltransferase [Microbacterium sp. M1A1_1b]
MQRDYGRQFADVYDEVFPPDGQLVAALLDSRPGTALELGIGTGRVAVPLAAAGVAVTGVDLSPEMLDRARSAAEREQVPLELVEGSMTDVRLDDRFDLVYCVCASISMLLERRQQRQALEVAAGHLAPGGRIVVETHNPDAVRSLHDGRRRETWFVPYPGTGRGLQSYGVLDEPRSLWQVSHLWHDGGTTSVGSEVSLLTPPEVLTGLAQHAGLAVRSVHGSWRGGPVTPDSPTYVAEFGAAA